jgi:Trp operon repressor
VTVPFHEVNIEEEIEDLGNHLTKSFNFKMVHQERSLKSVIRQINTKASQIQRDMNNMHTQAEDMKKALDEVIQRNALKT